MISPVTAGVVGLILMLVLMFLGLNLSFVFVICGIVGMTLIYGFPMGVNVLKTLPVTTSMSYSLSVLPMFILMGDLAVAGSLTTDAYKAARNWCGRLPGGLAVTTTVASALFGAICGSAQATGIVMSQLAWPEMKRYGYSPKIGVCSIVAAAPLAFLIPPSTPMITYGMLTGVSIGALFMGGVLPGILLMILLSLLTVFRCVLRPELAPRTDASTWKEKLSSLGGAWPILLLVLVMMYCIWGGVTTVNESAGLAVVCTLIICLLKHRVTGKSIPACMKESARNAAALFFLFVGIQVYNSFLSVTTLPTLLCNFILKLDMAPMMIVWAIIVLYILLGCFIDTVVIVMLTVPLFAPIISGLGFSLVWFGCLQTMMVGLGGITPPVGMILFVTCAGIKDVPMSAVMRDIWPYIGVTILVCVMVMYLPGLVTWLPSLM